MTVMSTPRLIAGLDELRTLVGEHLGYSDYLEITQERVDAFADATGDHQWIHVDVERAKAGPFGGPIAHGYLTLSLGPMLGDADVAGGGRRHGRQLRHRQAALPGAGAGRLAAAPRGPGARRSSDIDGGVQAKMSYVFEVEGAAKPSCVAEVLFRLYA